LCNVLGMHPRVQATPSSPLAVLVESMRQSWSQDESLLAQLDSSYEQVYQRLGRATRAFMEAWSQDTEQPPRIL
jgi:sulfotransferase